MDDLVGGPSGEALAYADECALAVAAPGGPASAGIIQSLDLHPSPAEEESA